LSPSEQKKVLEGQTELEPVSTTDVELDTARNRGVALQTEHDQFVANNSQYFDDQGNFKYYDY
jgi:hypothetical protein